MEEEDNRGEGSAPDEQGSGPPPDEQPPPQYPPPQYPPAQYPPPMYPPPQYAPPPQYPPPQYPPAAYPPPQYPYMPPPPTNGLAVGAMIAGIVGLFLIPIVGSITGIVLGSIAKKQIAQSQGREGGEGMATAGVVLGWIGLGLWLLLIVVGLILAAGLLSLADDVIEIIPSVSPSPL